MQLGKRRKAVVAVVVLAVVLPLAILGFLEWRYPHIDVQPEESNLSIRGIVNSVEENHRSEGWAAYHVYRYYLSVNISEVLWTDSELMEWFNDTKGEGPLNVGHIVYVGYDVSEQLQFAVGQTIECKGFFLLVTESPQSMKLTVAPAIAESYLTKVT